MLADIVLGSKQSSTYSKGTLPAFPACDHVGKSFGASFS